MRANQEEPRVDSTLQRFQTKLPTNCAGLEGTNRCVSNSVKQSLVDPV